MSDLRDMFFEECDDLLEVLSTGLEDLQNETSDAETINAMFRSVHSIKGGAGAFGLDRLIKFAHAFERKGRTVSGQNLPIACAHRTK